MESEQIERLQEQARKNYLDLQSVTLQRDDLTLKHKDALASLELVKTELAALKTDFNKRCNAAVQHAMATHGVPAIALGIESAPGTHAANPSKDVTGLERAIAANRKSKTVHFD